MNYTEAIDFIHSIPKFRRPLGNANLAKLLCLLENPQKKLQFVHIAGTNGKGSTAAMTAQILKEAGYKTGLFTSPYIETFAERIRINGEYISESDIAKYTLRVKNAMEKDGAYVSEFAFVTAMAFLYFCEKKCDIVVLEVGMGGKLDATNVIDDSLVSVICKIGLDHTEYLGCTIEEIAEEKCGIIRDGGYVVSYPNEEAASVIKRCAEEKHAHLIFADTARICENGFIYKGKKYALSLGGSYQPQNAAVVLETINVLCEKGMKISDTAVEDGLKNTQWPARFEFVTDNIVIDGGHNIDGITALKKSLDDLGREFVIVTAMMSDKAYDECLRMLAPKAKAVVATEVNMPRCLGAEKIAEIAESVGTAAFIRKNPTEAVKYAEEISDGALVVVCGSLYLAGEVRKNLKK